MMDFNNILTKVAALNSFKDYEEIKVIKRGDGWIVLIDILTRQICQYSTIISPARNGH